MPNNAMGIRKIPNRAPSVNSGYSLSTSGLIEAYVKKSAVACAPRPLQAQSAPPTELVGRPRAMVRPI